MPPPPRFSPEFLFPSLSAKHHSSDRFKLELVPIFAAGSFEEWFLGRLGLSQFTVDQFGIQAIDLWEGGLPKDKLDDAKYLARMRKEAEQAGTDLFLLMSGALDTSPQKGSEFSPGSRYFLPALRSTGRSFSAGFPQSPRYRRRPVFRQAWKPSSHWRMERLRKTSLLRSSRELLLLSQKGPFSLRSPASSSIPPQINADFGKLKDNVYKGPSHASPHRYGFMQDAQLRQEGNQPDFDYPAS